MKGSMDSSPVLPPFFHIERIISLGIDWQLHTVVRRLPLQRTLWLSPSPLLRENL
jgi:hypothetical protein